MQWEDAEELVQMEGLEQRTEIFCAVVCTVEQDFRDMPGDAHQASATVLPGPCVVGSWCLGRAPSLGGHL